MHFIDDNVLNNYTDMILEFPALQGMDDLTKENFKEVLLTIFHDLYVNKIESIQQYLQFEITEDIADQILKDYGIDKDVLNGINPLFKKSLVYFLEKLFQQKGSISVLKIFNQIFESLFSAINFYKIIVVKQPMTKINDDGTQTVEYLLTYALEPLYINDPTAVITVLDQQVSQTGKYLMDLEQFKDFKVFPVNTNLIYMQFTSTEVNLNNLNIFETAIRAYALTSLRGTEIPLRNFYGKNFNIEATDLVHIIFYLEYFRSKKINPDKDFYLDPDKAYTNLIMTKDSLNELESFLHEYKLLNMHDRKAMTDFKRRWKAFLRNFITTERLYHNFEELEDYIQENYPEIIEIRNSYLLTDDDYLQFYIDMYLIVLNNVPISDEYINLFINALFLSVITGEAFLEHFFLPIYKVFQKYFLPIELDFLANMAKTFFIRDKFEAISYDQFIAMDFETKAMSKRYLKPDIIYFYLLIDNIDNNTINDKITTIVENFIIDNTIKDEIFQTLINSYQADTIKRLDNQILTVLSYQYDETKPNDGFFTETQVDQDDKLTYDKYIAMTLDVLQESKQKINDINSSQVNSGNYDSLTYNEKKSSEIDRFNYTNLYDDLSTYLSFEVLETQTKISNLTNTYFKYSRADDQVYFTIHQIF